MNKKWDWDRGIDRKRDWDREMNKKKSGLEKCIGKGIEE
jgi:hypothetical protein